EDPSVCRSRIDPWRRSWRVRPPAACWSTSGLKKMGREQRGQREPQQISPPDQWLIGVPVLRDWFPITSRTGNPPQLETGTKLANKIKDLARKFPLFPLFPMINPEGATHL